VRRASLPQAGLGSRYSAHCAPMSLSYSPDRVVRGGSESGDSAASPCDAERDEELRLAAEMGQLLISQKRELQTALDAARGDARPCCPRASVCVVGGNAARGPPYRVRAEQRVGGAGG
jgi:hypothetical protein